MVNARDLKFHVCIPHEKIVDPYFFSCPSYAPFLSYVPLKTKFENLVCKISRKYLARAFIFGILVGADE